MAPQNMSVNLNKMSGRFFPNVSDQIFSAAIVCSISRGLLDIYWGVLIMMSGKKATV